MASTSKSVVEQCFKMREKSFMDSLDKILFRISRDGLSQQILQHEISEKYIAQRVEEIFLKYANSEREAYIDSLIEKIGSYQEKLENNELEFLKLSNLGSHSVEERVNDPSLDSSPSHRVVYGNYSILIKEVKNVRKQCSLIKSSFIDFVNKTSRIISVMNNKTAVATSLYSDKIKKLDAANRGYQEENDKIQETSANELGIVKMQLNERLTDINQLNETLQEKDGNILNLTNDLKETQQQLEETSKEYEKMEATLAPLQEESFANKAAIEKYEKILEDIKKENEKLRKDLSRFTNENGDVDKRMQEYEQEHRRVIILLDEQTEKNIQLTARLEKRKEQIRLLKQKFIELTEEVEHIQRKYKEMHAANQTMSKRNQSLLDQVSELTAKVEENEITIDDIQLASEQSKVQLNSEYLEAKQKISKLEESLAEQIQTNEFQKQQIENLTEEATKSSISRSKMIDHEKECESTIESQLEELSILKSQNEDYTSRLNSANETINAMKTKIVDQQKTIEENEDLVAEKSEIIENLKQTAEKKYTFIKQQNEKLNEATNSNMLLVQEKRVLENEISVIRSQMQRSLLKQDELERISENNASMKDKVNEQKNKVAQDLSTIMAATMTKSVKGAVDLIKEGRNAVKLLKAIRIALCMNGGEFDIIGKIKEIKELNQTASALLGDSSFEDIMKIKEEYGHSLLLLGVESNIPDAIENLKSIIKETARFINKVVFKIADPLQTVKMVKIPLSSETKEEIIQTIDVLKSTNEHNKSIITILIDEAKSNGFDGQDPRDAIKYISRHNISKEIDKLRDSLSKSILSHKEDIKAKNKEISDQKKVIFEMKQEKIKEKSAFDQQNDSLERQIRKLNVDLSNERILRSSINSIVKGESFDRAALSTSLTFQELKIIDLIRAQMKTTK